MKLYLLSVAAWKNSGNKKAPARVSNTLQELFMSEEQKALEKFEGVMVTKEYSPCDNTHTYRVYCPANWFGLCGWAE